MNYSNKKQTGLSLIEIQVALVIGLLLTAGAIQLFIGNQTTYRTEAALAQMQQVGRFALETMAKEIRMAGFTGCTSREALRGTEYSGLDLPPYDMTGINAKVAGSEAQGSNNWNPARPNLGGLLANMTDQTDMLTIQRADQCGTQLTANSDTTGAGLSIYTPNQCNFQANDPVMITNCERMEIFQIQADVADTAPSQTMNFNGLAQLTTDQLFNTSSTVHKVISNTFYISPSQADANINALWMSNWIPDGTAGAPTAADFNPIEIADGVDDLQILYGVDTGGVDEYADTYVTADQVAVVNLADSWNAVRSIRISLLLSSVADNITTEARAFQFNGADVNTANDRRLRAVYSTTVSIRNRLQ